MTERWQREVRKLSGVEPERDAWKRAATRAPGGDGLPPPRQRVVAGVVAFAVFAAAGLFLVRSFDRGQEGRLGDSKRGDGSHLVVTATSAEADEGALGSITLSVDGASVRGIGGTAGTQPVGDGEHPVGYPTQQLDRADFVEVTAGATLEIAGDADTVGTVVHIGDDPEGAETMSIDPSTLSTLASGYYVLRVEASWQTTTTETWSSKLFPIEIVEAPNEVPEEESEDSATYVFSDVVAGPTTAEPVDLAVSFTVSWSGQEYPGVHLCTYRAMAADGTLVGEFVHLAAWQPGRWHREIPGDPGAAARGEVSCEPERLDDPGIADVRSIPRSDGTSLDEITAAREDRLEDWAARWAVDSMTESQLAGNLWAIWTAMTQSHDSDLTISWQLEDRRHYLCVRLPPEHEFRGGEFCD
jgi:hypothetical protein